MLWLYIVGGILLFIFILLLFSATLVVTANNDEFYLDVKYMFLKFRVYPAKEKKPVKQPTDKPKKEAEDKTENKPQSDNADSVEQTVADNKSAEVKSEKTDEKKTADKEKTPKKKKKSKNPFEQIGDILDLLDGIGKYVFKLIKAIRITLALDMTVGGEDAAQAAINYGKYNAVIWGLIGHADAIMTVNPKRVNINCNFEFDRLLYSVYAKIKLRLITALVIVIGAGIRLLKNYIKKDR